MKKTMFITSVIMVIVLAVALTTSSLAWFSASGNATVYTDTLKVTAKATASDGIAISHNKTTWANHIELASGENVNTNLMPLVPFNKGDTVTADRLLTALVGGTEAPYFTLAEFAADYEKYVDTVEVDEEEVLNTATVAICADVYDAAAADTTSDWGYDEDATGLYGGDIYDEGEYDEETEELLPGKDGINDTFAAFYEKMIANGYISAQDIKGYDEDNEEIDRGAYMIGNKLAFNDLFSDNVYREGYYTDTMYIKNLATGTGAQPVTLNTIVSFYFSNPVATNEVDPDTNDPIIAYERKNYQRTFRGEKYDQDPTLCVAVIAKKNTASNGLFLTDEEYFEKFVLEKEIAYLQSQFDDLLANYEVAEEEYENWTRLQWDTHMAKVNDPEDPEEITECDETLLGYLDTIQQKQNAIDALTDYEWEIIAYAESKGAPGSNYIPSTLNMGLSAENFVLNADSKVSIDQLSTTDLNKANSTELRGEHAANLTQDQINAFQARLDNTDPTLDKDNSTETKEDDHYSGWYTLVEADVLEVKVVAWYDGTTLDNNNSNDGSKTADYSRGSANIEFQLDFITVSNTQQNNG